MNNIFRLGMALVIAIASSATASAQAGSAILISELQTATGDNASQEFIELYNPADTDQPLSGWTVEYKSATATDVAANWSKRATLRGLVKAHGFYLIAPRTYLANADADWSATLAASAGNVRLKNEAGTVVDQVGYGSTANAAEGGAPVLAPAAGQSVERLPGRLDELAGNGVDTANNAADFVARSTPEPQDSSSVIEPALDAATGPSVVEVDDPEPAVAPATPTTFLPAMITELLVDPISPLTDADDEFIELYNPSDQPLNLKNYALKAGANLHSYYLFPDTWVDPGAYLALRSSQTKLSLTNTGGVVQLVDPAGGVVDTTASYGKAIPGSSWAWFEDGWHWTIAATPGAANLLETPVVVAVATTTPKTAKASTKKATKTSTKTSKPKKVAVKKPKAAKAKKPKITTAAFKAPLAAARDLKPGTWLIIALGLLTISYATYEFRYDIYNLYHRLRGHPGAREAGRQPTEGGRGD